jgi:glycosyltransferase involved in cell wall biosynthesis
MNGGPLVTFGVPAYNRPHLLAETLASIAAQTAAVNYEVRVCDDGSDPDTAALVTRLADPRVFYHRNSPALGPIRNWNECLRRARAPWVTILHDDDTLSPWYLSSLLPRLRTGLAAVCPQVITGREPPAWRTPTSTPTVRPYLPRYFIRNSMTPFPGVLFARDLGLRLGGFDESAGPLADYDFWYRLTCAGPVEIVRCVAAFYRIGEGQWTERAWPEMLRRAHLMRLRIAREQCPRRARQARWIARFYTNRMARSFSRRFSEKPPSLVRARKLGRIPFGWLPSGWVWKYLQFSTRFTPERR